MSGILSGDAVRSKRRLYWHYGLYAGEIDEKKMVFENTRGGIRLVTLEEFSKGKKCEFIPYKGDTKREDIISRASSVIGKKRYNLLKSNCEHFVTWCQDDEAKSLQVRKGIKLSGIMVAAIGLGVAGKVIYGRIKKKHSLSG